MQKGPFDWLICPPRSLTQWLDAGLPLFEPGEITSHRGHAWWPRYSFWFWHGFLVKEETGRRLDIAATFEREREKLVYQRGRFSALDPGQTVWAISNTQNNLETEVFEPEEKTSYLFSEAAMERLQGALDRYFGAPCRILIITRADRCDLALRGWKNVHVLTTEPSEWKGDDASWRGLISSQLPSKTNS